MKNALLINKIQHTVKTKGPGRKAPCLLVTGSRQTATGSTHLSMWTLPISRTSPLHLALAHRGPSAPLWDLFYNSNQVEVPRTKNGVGRPDMKLFGRVHTCLPSPRSWIPSWHVEKTQDKRREKRWRESKEARMFSKEITKIIKDKNEVIIRKESLSIFWSPRWSPMLRSLSAWPLCAGLFS